MEAQIGAVRFQVTLTGTVSKWLGELASVEALTRLIREKYPEAEIVIDLRCE